MSAQSMLDQLLRQGLNLLQGQGQSAPSSGGDAAIGLMAYKAYSPWQAQQAQSVPSTGAPQPAALPAPRTVDQLAGPEAERHSQAILGAMIAAAKADGHLDARERGLLDAELARLAADHSLRQWLEAELQRPLDPALVARAAQGDAGLVAEMYLVSLLVADEQRTMERLYLDELARQLDLAPGLKARLDAQAAEA